MSGKVVKNFERETALVRQEVETVIKLTDIALPLRDGVCWQLSQEGKVLYTGDSICWSILPLLVCEAIGAANRHAAPGAAAMEFFFAAGDVFDDIQDHELEDSLVSVYGEEKALSIALALLMLSQQAVMRLQEKRVNPGKIISVIETISNGGLYSCTGQYYDLIYEAEGDISSESYLEMIGLKSAPLVEAACRVGAILATDDSHIVDLYGLFGWNLGIAAQIVNDARSITTTQWRRSDISKKKKTLPVIFAFDHADRRQRRLLEHVYYPDTIITLELQQEAARTIIALGGLYYSLIMAEKYKQLAVKAIKAYAANDSPLLALF